MRGLGDYTAVANLIQKQEGYFPGSLSYQNNNPGNLVYAGQPGATPVTINGVTWASFPTYEAGYQALLNQIALQANSGQTIQQFAAQYASSPGDNPTLYAQNIAAAVGLTPTDPLTSADVAAPVTGGIDLNSLGVDLSSLSIGGIDGGTVALGLAVLFLGFLAVEYS